MVLDVVAAGVIDPITILLREEPLGGAIESYKAFGCREAGRLKVEFAPTAQAAKY